MHLIIVDKDTNYGIEYSCDVIGLNILAASASTVLKCESHIFNFHSPSSLFVLFMEIIHTKKKEISLIVLQSTWYSIRTQSIFIIYNMYSEISVRVQCRKRWFPFTATSVDSTTSQAQTTLTRNLRIQQLMLYVRAAFRMHPLFQLGSRCVCYKIAFDSSPDARSQPNFLLVFNRMHSPRFDSVSRKLSFS